MEARGLEAGTLFLGGIESDVVRFVDHGLAGRLSFDRRRCCGSDLARRWRCGRCGLAARTAAEREREREQSDAEIRAPHLGDRTTLERTAEPGLTVLRARRDPRAMRLLSSVASVPLAALVVATGCVRVIPPPATPDPLAPAIDTRSLAAPAEGHGRVLVDVVDGPTEVRRFETTQIVVDDKNKDRPLVVNETFTTFVCVSPCVVDMPLGRQSLAFPTRGRRNRYEVGEVDFAPEPTVYRRALGSYRSGGAGLVLGILGAAFGGAAVITGMTLLPVGLALDDDAMALAGGISFAAGGLLTGLGVWAISESPSTEQPGASIQLAWPAGATP